MAWKLGRSEARRSARERKSAKPEATPSTVEMVERLEARQRVLGCVHALDHEDMEFDVDVEPDADGNFSHTVELVRVSPPTKQILLTVVVTDASSGVPVSARAGRLRAPEPAREPGGAERTLVNRSESVGPSELRKV